ncbi:hypothetical protein ACGFJT_37275 [Actinomadura geliboluensis]|uniref:hypothetical protein n=1 Tax=Actinomadura geliboluensis TaxID=882440 RepID=UPI00371F51EE
MTPLSPDQALQFLSKVLGSFASTGGLPTLGLLHTVDGTQPFAEVLRTLDVEGIDPRSVDAALGSAIDTGALLALAEGIIHLAVLAYTVVEVELPEHASIGHRDQAQAHADHGDLTSYPGAVDVIKVYASARDGHRWAARWGPGDDAPPVLLDPASRAAADEGVLAGHVRAAVDLDW